MYYSKNFLFLNLIINFLKFFIFKCYYMNENDGNKFQTTAIKNELKEFESLKKKNEMDLLNSVEYE